MGKAAEVSGHVDRHSSGTAARAAATRFSFQEPTMKTIQTLLVSSALMLAAAAPAMAQQRYVIERDIPGASKMSAEQLRDAARQSNAVLKDMGTDIQWVQSYVAGDKIYCVYNATSEGLIREHARKSGFPANRITPVAAMFDPTTATAAVR
jgi:hypothetical protein